jgi:hypothetical protein
MSVATTTLRRSAAVLVIAGGLTAGATAPAMAAPNNNTQSGLVNVNLQDINAQVPVAVAANICGLPVSVLAQGLATGPVNCDANGQATATRNPGTGNNQNNQNGLVNINGQAVNVQIPIGVAANVCGVPISILATALATGPVTCDANGIATATG